MSWLSFTPYIVIIFALLISDLLCSDVTHTGLLVNNARSNGNNKNINDTLMNTYQKSTTPWPALGQRQQSSQQGSNAFSKQGNHALWVRPNNGTIWIKNTQSFQTNPSWGQSLQTVSSHQKTGSGQVTVNLSKAVNQPGQLNNNKYGIQSISSPQGTGSGQAIANIPKLQNNSPKSEIGQSISKVQNIHSKGHPSLVSSNYNTQFIHAERNRQNIGLNTNNRDALAMLPNSDNKNHGMNHSISSGSKYDQTTEITNSKVSNDKQDNGAVEDFELRELSEELYNKDINNAAKYVAINLQGITTSRSMNDEAPLPLLTINQAAFSIPSVAKTMALYNNYILETNQNEVYTAQEKLEENDLLDTILITPVMQHTRNFLIKKGKIGKDPKEFKDLLRLIWFNMYSRGGGRIGSSGFEHVFLAELKNNQVSGLHNWLYFSEEEKRNNLNYLGYMKKIDLGTKGVILKLHLTYHNVDKPVGSIFIGTSPELELAVYSACFILRADKICLLKMNGNRFIVRTFTYRYRGKNMIGSAFPEI